MATLVGIGFSQDTDPVTAAKTAAREAQNNLNQERIDFVLFFHTSHYNPEDILPSLYDSFNTPKIIGSSSAGIILPHRVETRGVGAIAINSDDIKFEDGHVTHLDLQDGFSAGEALVKECLTEFGSQNRKALLFFIDGLYKYTTQFTRGVKKATQASFPIVGAGSSDAFHFEKTFQHFHNKSFTQSAVGILIGGHVTVTTSCHHGWRPLGKPRTITKSENNIINTIDGKPAFSIYEEFFDQDASSLKTNPLGPLSARYPLGIKLNGSNQYLLRNITSVLDDGSLVCQDSVLPNAEVHMMIGDTDSLLQATKKAAKELKENLSKNPPYLIIILESLARYKVLGRKAKKEINIIKDILGETVPVFGMYSHGETSFDITSPDPAQEHLRNASMSLLAFS
ncbi:MAG: FIST C-terminal domain-containing protein [Candidatus Omnitrophica bacterium]|nr:FIST C-terminal domain-containing protein [Candidatus Omnitrophota bacterium]